MPDALTVRPTVCLPYGLSDAHRELRTMGKVMMYPHVGPTIWQTSSLQELSSTPIVLPIVHNQRNLSRSRKSIKILVRTRDDIEMGVARREEGMAKSKAALARQSRERAPKSHMHRRKIATDAGGAPFVPPRKRTVGPGTRIGTLKEMPILIEGDEDDDTQVGVTAGRSTLRNRDLTPPSTPIFQSVYSPLPGSITSSRLSKPASASPSDISYMQRETSLYVGLAPSLPSYSPPRVHISSDSRPSPQIIASIKFSGKDCGVSMRAPTQGGAAPGLARNMTLADIPDFDLRRKVAALMAVAPALPVRDHYDLLMDLEGDLTAARWEALRASKAPQEQRVIRDEEVLISGSARRERASSRLYVARDDELMVKIDPNDAFLEWDSDTPPPPPAVETRPKAKKVPLAKKSRTKATRKLPKGPAPLMTTILKTGASRQLTSEKRHSNITVNRTAAPRKENRRQQYVSVNRQFVVPEYEIISSDSDMCNDSDLEMLDGPPEDL